MSTLALFCCVNISYSEECPVFVVTFEKNVVSVCHYCSTPPHKLHTLPSFSSDCKSVPVQRAGAEIAQHLKTKAKPTKTNIHQRESTIQTCKWCLMSILCQPNCHTMKDLQTRVPIIINYNLFKCWFNTLIGALAELCIFQPILRIIKYCLHVSMSD